MLPTRQELLAKAAALKERPVAIEAFWDGDSTGWFLTLSAIVKSRQKYRDRFLGALRDGGDLRLFNGQVPPWPEAQLARTVGEELAREFGVPFYFPSPNYPEDQCPRWWEQDQGYPCSRCGIPLLQTREPCPWRGICYQCYLAKKREEKEASWTPEERSGPRCSVCGNPAKTMLGSRQVCLSCFERYDVYRCSRCELSGLRPKSESKSDLCKACDFRDRFDAVPKEHRDRIGRAHAESGMSAALHTAEELLGWEFYDCVHAVDEIKSGIAFDPKARRPG